MTQAVRARTPRPLWLITVLLLVAISAMASVLLTSTIDTRVRGRFADEASRYTTGLENRLQGLAVIGAVLPMAMSPDLGGLSIESIEGMLRGSDPAQAFEVMQAFTAFPLDGLAAFAFADLTAGLDLTALPSAGGLDDGEMAKAVERRR